MLLSLVERIGSRGEGTGPTPVAIFGLLLSLRGRSGGHQQGPGQTRHGWSGLAASGHYGDTGAGILTSVGTGSLVVPVAIPVFADVGIRHYLRAID